MTATSMVYMLIGRRITLKDRIVIKDSLGETHLQGVVRMTRSVLIVTAAAEAAGILLLSLRFIPEYGAARGFYYSVFHSISSFCNAGFDVFEMCIRDRMWIPQLSAWSFLTPHAMSRGTAIRR